MNEVEVEVVVVVVDVVVFPVFVLVVLNVDLVDCGGHSCRLARKVVQG